MNYEYFDARGPFHANVIVIGGINQNSNQEKMSFKSLRWEGKNTHTLIHANFDLLFASQSYVCPFYSYASFVDNNVPDVDDR